MAETIKWMGEGAFHGQVAGESHYSDSLRKIAGEEKRTRVMAQLLPENDNAFDKNAIRVEIQGLTVGYLPRADARTYRAKLRQLGKIDAIGECSAVVVRGAENAYGVYLDLPIDEDEEDEEEKDDEDDEEGESLGGMNPIGLGGTSSVKQKKRKPWIGGLGLLLLAIGICTIGQSSGGPLVIAGGLLLVYALLTGNVKLFG